MKKFLLLPIFAVLTGSNMTISAQDVANVKLFSFTVAPEAVGKTTYIKVSATDGQQVQVDWGNGQKSEATKLANYDDAGWVFTQIDGEIKGTDIVVYGSATETINYVDLSYETAKAAEAKLLTLDVSPLNGTISEFGATGNLLKSLDLSANTKFVTVALGSNALTSLTLPENSTIKSIDVSNADASGEKGTNQIASANWAKLTALTTLKMNYNKSDKFIDLDFSPLANLTTVNANECNIKTINVSKNAKLKTLNLTGNALTTLDASAMLAKSIIFANNNKLTSIKAPKGMTRLNISGNALSFATLPLASDLGITNASNYVYAPQKELTVEVNSNTVDLSAQAKAGDNETTFAWAVAGEAFTAYNEANGVFTFTQSANELVCTMTNETFPKLTLTTSPVNVNVQTSAIDDIEADNAGMPVEYYNMQGVKVSGNEPGLYIRRQGDKTSKVIVK